MVVSANKAPEDPTQVFLLIENRLMRESLFRLFRKRSDVCVVGQRSPVEPPASPESLGDIVILDDLHAAIELSTRLRGSEILPAPWGWC